jgi:general secretion pathway protein D
VPVAACGVRRLRFPCFLTKLNSTGEANLLDESQALERLGQGEQHRRKRALAAMTMIAAGLISAHGPSRAQTPSEARAQSETQESEPLVRRGSGEFVAPPVDIAPPPAQSSDARTLDIAFDRAPVALVAQALLVDMAGANVVIDPRVSGELTIHSHGQLTAAELPNFLRRALAAIDVELIEQSPGAYLVRPSAGAGQQAGTPAIHRPGQATRAGLVILGLQHVSATEMTRLLLPFARNGVTVQPESSRELLILSGPPEQVQSLIQTVELLDVDWLAGMSFGLVPLEYSEPEQLIEELRTLFGGASGPIGSMVEFVPMPARRAVLILAKRPERLDEARNWIAQLDRPMSGGLGRLHFLPLVNADATRVAETISNLLDASEGTNVRITADTGRNALLIQADSATLQDLLALIAQLDAPVDQVMIETTIAEVALNNDFRFGVQWSVDTRNGGIATLSESSNGATASRFPGFSYNYEGNFVNATLNALASRTNVEVISSPVVVTLDNQEATLQVGDEVPIVTQSAVGVGTSDAPIVNSVEYRDTGILLTVKPHISSNGTVTLEVTQEASEVAATTTSGIDSPTIQQRKFHSTVQVADGQTVALGGLIRATRTRTRGGVPFLSSIPILGAAFRNTSNAVRRTELLVFLTPRIVHTSEDAAMVTSDLQRRLERLRESRFIRGVAAPH